jgi:hypothetical protein
VYLRINIEKITPRALTRKEIDVIKKTSYYRSFNFSFFFSASRFILLCTFLVFGLTGEVSRV